MIALFLGGNLFAQTAGDISQFQAWDLQGSPRFTAMGGAFTSLGNDLSSLHLNPAGLSVYRFSEIGFSLGWQSERARLGSFYDRSSTERTNTIYNGHFGAAFRFKLGRGPYSEFGASISYTKKADYDRNWNILGGLNNNTLGEFWGESSAGLNINQISDDAYAAWQAYLLVDTTNAGNTFIRDSLDSYAFGRLDNGRLISNSEVQYMQNQSGSLGETALSFAGRIGNTFYYGLGFGFPSLNFRKEEFITEYLLENGSAPYNAKEYTYRRFNDIYGTGFNLKLGFIYRPIEEFRLGASYQSPSWFTVTQLYEFDINANFDSPPFPGVSRATQSDLFSTNEYAYGLTSPAIYRLGLSSVLFKSWILSVDYQYTSPNNSDIYLGRNGYNISNDLLEGSYQPELNALLAQDRNSLSLGTEVRLGAFSLRAGYRTAESPFAPSFVESTLGDAVNLSGGLGFKTGAWSFDLAYVQARFKSNQVVYNGEDVKTGETVQVLEDLPAQIKQNRILLGASYKF